jgi:peptide chain release factor subunit 1
MFDSRLQTKVIKLVDVSYGGENGFNQVFSLGSAFNEFFTEFF